MLKQNCSSIACPSERVPTLPSSPSIQPSADTNQTVQGLGCSAPRDVTPRKNTIDLIENGKDILKRSIFDFKLFKTYSAKSTCCISQVTRNIPACDNFKVFPGHAYTILHVSRLHLCRQFPSLFVSASLTALYFSPCFWVWREAVSISQSPPNTRIFRIEPWRVYLLLCGSTRTKHQTKMNVQHQWPWILFMDRKTRGKALGQRLWDIRKSPHLCSSWAVLNFRVSGLWRHLRHPGKAGIMWDPCSCIFP